MEVYLGRYLRATTKKRSSTFWGKKCTPRQNPGYAYRWTATALDEVHPEAKKKKKKKKAPAVNDANKLLDEQQQDVPLSDCWNMSRRGKCNFVVSRGLLYRKDKVECQAVCQLCVPTTRHCLRPPRDSVYIGHLGERKVNVSSCRFTGQV